MKFTLHSRIQNDPFGDEPIVVDVPDVPTRLSPGGFKLADVPFLPPSSPVASSTDDNNFAGLGSSPDRSSRFGKFNLVPASRDDDFFGDTVRKAVKQEAPSSCPWGNDSIPPLNFTMADSTFTKGAAADFQKFSQFTKVQETADGNVLVWGIATLEQPDMDGETCDYDSAKRAYQDWTTAAVKRTSAAGQEISLGPIRRQHSAEPAGKATKIEYNDDAKEIWLGSIPISDDIRKELQEGYLTGYSQGGSYGWRKCAECDKSLTLQQANNYCPGCKKKVPVRFGLGRLSEVSYVDSPCTGKGFNYVKSDGSSQFVTFTKRAPSFNDAVRLEELRVLGFLPRS